MPIKKKTAAKKITGRKRRLPSLKAKRTRTRASASRTKTSRAYRAGLRYGRMHRKRKIRLNKIQAEINTRYGKWSRIAGVNPHTETGRIAKKRFGVGFRRGARVAAASSANARPRKGKRPPTRNTAAVLSVRAGQEVSLSLLNELRRLPLGEILIVAGGWEAERVQRLLDHPSRPTLIHFPEPPDPDTGRAIGAKASRSELLLFLDGEVHLTAGELLPLLQTAKQGADIALADIGAAMGYFQQWDTAGILNAFVNQSFGRADLGPGSLTELPFAIRRTAAERIGFPHLADPSHAHVLSLQSGMDIRVSPGAAVSYYRMRLHSAVSTAEEDHELGDRLEALHAAMAVGGPRLGYGDSIRNRNYAGEEGQ